jgi:hypothetical protein
MPTPEREEKEVKKKRKGGYVWYRRHPICRFPATYHLTP